MARKKNINEESIIKFYMEYVLTYGKKPDSVFSFSKQYNFTEEDYYKYYGNFSLLEQSIFKVFWEQDPKNSDWKTKFEETFTIDIDSFYSSLTSWYR